MCGIAGIISFRGPADRDLISQMTRALAHRGPDGEGLMLRDNVALGHRRLAIIDLAGGAQPMANEDGHVWVTFNGEIYNYLELRHQLEALGHTFKTHSDTEVIVHAYEAWGKTCVERFRGMFAFALVDFAHRRGLLARDHFGIKPLYYRHDHPHSGLLAFASELHALKGIGGPASALTGSLQAIEYFLRFQYIPGPGTIYREISSLPPASRLEFTFDGHVGEPERYWHLDFAPEHGIAEAEWEERFAAALQESVRAHLVSDVPFGVFISGGVDSSLIALAMSRLLNRPVQGFCIGFDEAEYSETPYAQQVADACGFPLTTHIVRDDFWDDLPALVAHYGQPFGDSSIVPTWAVAKLARTGGGGGGSGGAGGVPMVLSGDGGDEAFAGYDSYEGWLNPTLAGPWNRLKKFHSRTELQSLAWAFARRGWGSTWAVPLEWQRLIQYSTWRQRHALWNAEHHPLIRAGCGLFDQAHRESPRTDPLAYAQYMDYQTYLPCDILPKVDVASMFHGLEVRTPLIDLHIANLARRLPQNMRMRRSTPPPHADADTRSQIPLGNLPWQRKILPKALLRRAFPPEFVDRKKQGFTIPRDRWFLPGRKGRQLLEDVVLGPHSRLAEWFNHAALEQTIASHSLQNDRSNFLWLLLVLGLWLEHNKDVDFA